MILKNLKDLKRLDELIEAGKRPKEIIAFKYVEKLKSPYYPRKDITFVEEAVIQVSRVNRNANVDCGMGLNASTLSWVLEEFNCCSIKQLKLKWNKDYETVGYKLIKVLITGNIIVIPHRKLGIGPLWKTREYYGKFRTNELKVLT